MGWLLVLISCFSLWYFFLRIFSSNGIRAYGLQLWASIVWPCIESLPDGGLQVRSCLLLVEGECINVEEGLSLEEKIVRYSSVSLSHTLDRNKKVKQHIRKKTHKPNALKFWVEGGVIPYMVWLSSRYLRSVFSPLILPTIGIQPFYNFFLVKFYNYLDTKHCLYKGKYLR